MCVSSVVRWLFGWTPWAGWPRWAALLWRLCHKMPLLCIPHSTLEKREKWSGRVRLISWEWLGKTSSLLIPQLGDFKQCTGNGFGAQGCVFHLWLHHVPAMTLSRVFNFLSVVSIYKICTTYLLVLLWGLTAVTFVNHQAQHFPFPLTSTLDLCFTMAVINSSKNHFWGQIKLVSESATLGAWGDGPAELPAQDSINSDPGRIVDGLLGNSHQDRRG